ncbi:MAG: isopentenyl phosphate kinase [Halodesulfurarchaeum sp.]
MTVVLKLGGSLITQKDERETVDTDALTEAGRIISEAEVPELVVVHGAGSFGHYHADSFGVSKGSGTRNTEAIRQIHDAMGRLNKAVLDYLNDHGLPAIPVRPLSTGYRPEADAVWLATDQVEAMLEEGFLPVLHGDVFTTRGAGATIVSGDELVVSLAESLDADRIGLCSGVPGVLDADGAVIDRIETFDDAAAVLGESEETDVTGGMAEKVRTLLGTDVPASIFDLEGLPAFLAAESPGTRIE